MSTLYNPFDKKIDALTLEDIKTLAERQVKEGLYVEYKSIFPSTSLKIAHSIASFANTHGGWYFVGIESNQTNLPTNFSGFSITDQPKPIEHLRNIVKDNIDPFPIYYSKLIEVASGKTILVVEIPESDETPHITKDGRIYRRNAEGSDPVLETNRYILDRLYEKSMNLQKEIESFCCREIISSGVEKNNSWIEVYLMTYPVNQLEVEHFFEESFIAGFKKLMNDSTTVEFIEKSYLSIQVPFNILSSSYNSMVMRQVIPGQLPFMGLTFELFRNGNAKIILPCPLIPSVAKLESPAWTKLVSILENEDISMFHILNGFDILSVFLTLFQKYIDFLKSQNWKNNILIAYKLENTGRTILFLNSDALIKHIDQYGVPICQRKSAWVPSKLKKTSMIEEMPKNGMFQLVQFMWIASHFGIFPIEWPTFVAEWLGSLPKTETAQKNENKSQG